MLVAIKFKFLHCTTRVKEMRFTAAEQKHLMEICQTDGLSSMEHIGMGWMRGEICRNFDWIVVKDDNSSKARACFHFWKIIIIVCIWKKKKIKDKKSKQQKERLQWKKCIEINLFLQLETVYKDNFHILYFYYYYCWYRLFANWMENINILF